MAGIPAPRAGLDLRLPPGEPLRHSAGDLAPADEPDRLPLQHPGLHHTRTWKILAEHRLGPVQVVDRREEQQDRRFGHALGVLDDLAIGDDDAGLGRSGDVDAVYAGDWRDDPAQLV